ncbi:hypothetical protein F5Y18DRAFT_428436 [Xylariaceae sp. FL1019]|nr:hypothetical protein F5Y18DRAFT_428436 [Xylariaceae sp. FL1019]
MADSSDLGFDFDTGVFNSEAANINYDMDDPKEGGPSFNILGDINGHNATESPPQIQIEPGIEEPAGQTLMTNNEHQTVSLQTIAAPTPEELLTMPAPTFVEVTGSAANELNSDTNALVLPQDSNEQFMNDIQGSHDWSWQAAQVRQHYDGESYYRSAAAVLPTSAGWTNDMPNTMLNAAASIQPMPSTYPMPQPTQAYYNPNTYGTSYQPPPNLNPAFYPSMNYNELSNGPPLQGPRAMAPGSYSLNSHGSLPQRQFSAKFSGPPSADPDLEDRDFVDPPKRLKVGADGEPLQNGKIPRHTRRKGDSPDAAAERAKAISRKHYGQLPPPYPQSWGPKGPDPKDVPLFTYNQHGELATALVLTKQQMRWYLLGPTQKERDGGEFHQFLMPQILPGVRRFRNKIRQGLTLWIGQPPAQANYRLPREGSSTRCRLADCPYEGRTIRSGQFIVVFDERQNVDGDLYDPYYNAGYAHLWCVERCLDLVQLWRCVDIQLDYRTFKREDYSPFKINTSGMGSDAAAKEWWRRNCHEKRPQGQKRTYEQSLQYALSKYKVEHVTTGQRKTMNNRDGADISKHFNDPEIIKRLKAAQKDSSTTADANNKKVKKEVANERKGKERANQRKAKKRARRRNNMKSAESESESDVASESEFAGEGEIEGEIEPEVEPVVEPRVAPEAVVDHNVDPRLSDVPFSPQPTPPVRHDAYGHIVPRFDATVQTESLANVNAEYVNVGVQFPSPPRSLPLTNPARSPPPTLSPERRKRRRSDSDSEDESSRPFKQIKVESDPDLWSEDSLQ